jgi:hypothetical protein
VRALFLGVVVVTCAAAYACDSFEESNAPPPEADAGDGGAGSTDAAPDVVTPCDGEPEWAYPGGPVPTLAACNAAPGVDLLTSAEHCGRCSHSCGSDGTCKDGLCAPKREDTVISVPHRVADGALYYARRPGLGAADEVVRIVPGGTPLVLGKLDPDAGSDREIVSMAVASDGLYVRTKESLRRTSRTDASDAIPTLVATLSAEQTSFVTLAPDGRLIAAAASAKRYDAVTTTGEVSPFITGIDVPLEAAFAGDRFVWMSQPFHYFGGTGNSLLRIREGGTDRLLFDSAQNMGGLVIEGDQAFVIRNSSAGGSILAIDLKDGKQHSLFDGTLANAAFQLTLAVDATHVYWVKSVDPNGLQSELWKRARCGGAAVRIASHPFMLTPKLVGDHVYYGAGDGLWSVAK